MTTSTIDAGETSGLRMSTPSMATGRDDSPSGRPLPAPAVPRWWGELSWALTWASLLVVAGLWLANGGVTGVTNVADAWTSMGRLTGLLASDLLLIQVLLMARIPFVEKAFGQDELAAIHRQVGFGSFSLMLAHIAMILVGYSGASLGALWPTFWQVTTTMPAMLIALLGTLCLVMVVVTSMRAARRRLRYESWHLIHLYAYLGCFLALPHQLWTGQDFLASPLATAYWWGLWGAAVAAVLTYRVGLPVLRNLRHRLVVAQVSPAGGNVTTVTVTGRDLDRLPAAGGQFFQWRFLDGPGWTRAHPYSVSAAPDGRSLQISVADVGDGSHRLATLKPGTRVLIEGPYGRLHQGARTRQGVLLLAAGIGVAPMRALMESLDAQPGDLTLIYRVSDFAGAPLLAQVEASAARCGARLIVLDGHRVVERPSWLPAAWSHLTDEAALRHLVPDVAERDVFLCGGNAWMDAAQAAARGAGVPAERIHAERFAY
jgi:predicted ferric reductase